jgi:hypothetical protein
LHRKTTKHDKYPLISHFSGMKEAKLKKKEMWGRKKEMNEGKIIE